MTKKSVTGLKLANIFRFSCLTSHKSCALTTVVGLRPMSDHEAVIAALDELLFHKITATLLLLRGPAQTFYFVHERKRKGGKNSDNQP